MRVNLLLVSTNDVSAGLGERIKEFSNWAPTLETHQLAVVAVQVEENSEGKCVEVHVPVKPAEGSQVKADQSGQGGVVADGTVHVTVGGVGFKHQRCIRSEVGDKEIQVITKLRRVKDR